MDSSQGFPNLKAIMLYVVVVDFLTKDVHFIALSHPFTTSIVAKVFLENIQKLHGTLKVIVSDHDPIFTSHFWKDLFSCLGTQLAHSSSYHPQSDEKLRFLIIFWKDMYVVSL